MKLYSKGAAMSPEHCAWRCDAPGCGAEARGRDFFLRAGWSQAYRDGDGRDYQLCPVHARAWDAYLETLRGWQDARAARGRAAKLLAEAEYVAAHPAPTEPFALGGAR